MSAPNEFIPATSHTFHHDGVSPLVIQAAHSNSNFPSTTNTNGPHFNGTGFFPNSIGYDVAMLPLFHHTSQRSAHFNAFAHQKQIPSDNTSKQDLPQILAPPDGRSNVFNTESTNNSVQSAYWSRQSQLSPFGVLPHEISPDHIEADTKSYDVNTHFSTTPAVNNLNSLAHTDCDKKSQVIVSDKSKDISNLKKYAPKAVSDVKMHNILSPNSYTQNDLVYRNGVINHGSHANVTKMNSNYKSATKHNETMESLPAVVNETLCPVPRDYRVFKSSPIQFGANPSPVVNFTGKANKQYLHKQMNVNKVAQNGSAALKNQQRMNSNASPSMIQHKMNDFQSQSSPVSLTSDDIAEHGRYNDVIRPAGSLKENDQFNMSQVAANTIAHGAAPAPGASVYREMLTDMNCQDGKKVTQNFAKLPYSPGNMQNNVMADRNRASFPSLYLAYNKPAMATSPPVVVQKAPQEKVTERNDTQNTAGTPPMMAKSPLQNGLVGYSSVIMRTDRNYESEEKSDKLSRQMMWPTDRQNHATVAAAKTDKVLPQNHIQPTVVNQQHLLLGLTERQHSYFDTTPGPSQMNTQSMTNVKCNPKPIAKIYDDRIQESHQPQVTQPQEPIHHYQQYMQIPNKAAMAQQIEPVVPPSQEPAVVEKPYSRKRKSSKTSEPTRHALSTDYTVRDPPPAHLNMYQQPLQTPGYMMETSRYDVAHSMPKMYPNSEQFYPQPAANNYINPATNVSHDPTQHQSVISSHSNVATRHTPSTTSHQIRNVPAPIASSLPLSAYFSTFQPNTTPYTHHDYHPAPSEPPPPITVAGYNINDVQIFPETAPNKLEKDLYEGRAKVIVPNIEEEFNFLFDPGTPNFKQFAAVGEEETFSKSSVKPMFYRKNIDFLASYIKFLENNCESVESLTDGNSSTLKTWNRNKVVYQPITRDETGEPVAPAAPPKEPPKQKEPETNFENDPRYYPLPKSSDKRRLDSSSDESSDEFSKKPKPIVKKPIEEKKKESVKPKKEIKKVKFKKSPVEDTKTTVKTKLEILKKSKIKIDNQQTKVDKKTLKIDQIKPKMDKTMEKMKSSKQSGLQKKSKDIVKETKEVPRRKVSNRKVKDGVLLKQKILDAIDSEDDDQCDSDSDPSWTPCADDEESGPKRKGMRIRAVRFKTKTARKTDSTSFKQNFTESHKKESVRKKETQKNSKTSNTRHKLKPFLILKKEASAKHPHLWRIQDEFRLQKLEHYESEGRHLYRNTSEFCKFSETDKNKYQEVEVTIIEEKNDKLIIELCDDTEIPTDLKIKENFMKESLCYEHQFAVYIQTLVSQALDSSFLSEIVKENDVYFLSNMKVIDEVTATYLSDLTGVVKWKNNSLYILVKTWPFISIKSIRTDTTKMKCTSCNTTNSKQTAIFYGPPYQRETLQGCKPSSIPNDIDKTVDLCKNCSREVKLFNKIWHQKYHTFIECAKYVSKKKSEDKTKGTTDILNELLADTAWLTKLFYDIRITWLQIWTIVQKSKES